MQQKKQKQQTIQILDKTIVIGPGTVPRSPGSLEKTDIDKVVKHMRRFSALGGYGDDEEDK